MKYISNEAITIKSLYNLQLLFYCAAADPCHPQPCKNKGTCRAVGELDFRCDCPPGLTGKTCEIGKPTNAPVFATITRRSCLYSWGGGGGGSSAKCCLVRIFAKRVEAGQGRSWLRCEDFVIKNT